MKIKLSPELLEAYYTKGLALKPKALSKKSTRRAHFRWLKDDSDTRTWDEAFQARCVEHIELYNKLYESKLDMFTPEIIGSVEFDRKSLIFKNKFFPDLKITHPKMNKTWLRKKINQYKRENQCEISVNALWDFGITNILTKISL